MKRVLQNFAAAALSLTAYSNCAPVTHTSFADLQSVPDGTILARLLIDADKPYAFVFSRQQKDDILTQGLRPAEVCFPNMNRVMLVTNITSPYGELQEQREKFSDSIVLGIFRKDQILMLKYADGAPAPNVHDIARHVVTKDNQTQMLDCVLEYLQHQNRQYYKYQTAPPRSPIPDVPSDDRPRLTRRMTLG